jgi:Uma2 family endonuclease
MAVLDVTMSKVHHSERWYPPPQGAWTYADYLQLPDNNMRYEIIGGNLYMSPAPRPKHQQISANLLVALHEFVKKNQLGQVYHAPIDVILPDLATPVQPDLLFIPKESLGIVGEVNVKGAPRLVIEIISPGNPAHDRNIKFNLYAQAGVTEYWIVDGEAQMIDVFVLRGQAYAPLGQFTINDELFSEVLPGFSVKVADVM